MGRARAAWTAASPSVTRAARWATSSRTSTTSSTRVSGTARWLLCTPRTTSRSSRDASAPRPARPPARSRSTTDPVTIEYIEKAIADRGWEEGWIKPQPPATRTGKRVAVIGSGPSGLAAAQQLNRAGHSVTVFERDNYIGGLLRLGIPDFKLEKHARRAPRAADARRGHRVPYRRLRRPELRCRGPEERFRRRPALHRLDDAARPATFPGESSRASTSRWTS